MKTDRDFAKLCALFLGSFVFGGVLFFGMTSCRMTEGAGRDLKESAKWLPEPYGTIADVTGTALVMLAGHKTVRHIGKRRAARHAAKAATP